MGPVGDQLGLLARELLVTLDDDIAVQRVEFYVLELTDDGFREVAHNRVNHPICWCSHATPVFHGNRLYYRTWGHRYCFEDTEAHK